MTMSPGRSGKAWEIVENEKKRDEFVKKVSFIAWIVAFILAGILGILVIARVVTVWIYILGEGLGYTDVIRAIMPSFILLGALTFIVASVSTIGVFLRLRSASLSEIQLRLAALEDLLVDRSNSAR